MDAAFREALVTGYERLGAWAELLDRINVFPVADGDTGRNLVISLAPLRRTELARDTLVRALLLGARGNSGNIGVRFLEGFVAADEAPLKTRVTQGRDLAWKAVRDPKPGTMLSLFDELVEALDESSVRPDGSAVAALLDRLAETVRRTRERLPELRAAGVPDAGAVGLFLFCEGFLARLCGRMEDLRDPTARFPEAVGFRPGPAGSEAGFCVDAVVRTAGVDDAALRALDDAGESVVAVRRGEFVKVHLHARDQDALRRRLEALGAVVRWSADDLHEQAEEFARPEAPQAIHVMTDAAGSLSRDEARREGITLLDSYISVGERAVPETSLSQEELFAAMRVGERVSTSQASVFERHQHYERVLRLHGRVLYLCVGSVFTGNHAVVTEWLRERGQEERMVVLDSGAASGRLGLMARAVARRARDVSAADEVVAYARRVVEACREWVFLDRLQWLAAGGRLSKTSAFFGDLLRVKPIVSPLPEGAKKVGAVRRAAEQLPFALARLAETLGPRGEGCVLLQHSDNRERIEREILPALRERFPAATLEVGPLSNTSGAHMGPGTWGVAALPAGL
jgi:DegV family protein with EDD domain